jgi:hypothetical protein
MDRNKLPIHDSGSDVIGLHPNEIEAAKRIQHALDQLPDYPWDVPILNYEDQTLDFSQMDNEACINFVGMLGQFIELDVIDKASVVGILAKCGTAIAYVRKHYH